MEKNNNKVREAVNENASLTISERINRRLLAPVQVRHTNPNYCILTINRRGGKGGEKVFQGYQTQTMLIQELINIANTTKLFKGEDGKGKNAALFIEDAELREYLGFDVVDENGKLVESQSILDDEAVLSVLNNPKKKDFEKSISEFKNNITKTKLLQDVIKRTKFNDAQKIKYVENVLDINIDL